MGNPKQKNLFEEDKTVSEKDGSGFGDTNFVDNKVEPIHRWVPWIAGFSSDFVHGIIESELDSRGTVLDPFAGVGTTLIEAAIMGHDTIGFEINPYAVLATRVKLGARTTVPGDFEDEIDRFEVFYNNKVDSDYEPRSTPPSGFNTRAEFYAPKVERKVLIYWDFVDTIDDETIRDLFRIAFASEMITFANYSYEPSLGTHNAADRPRIDDFSVGATLYKKLSQMLSDIRWFQDETKASEVSGKIVEESFFDCSNHMRNGGADLAITSPPYLNNYHYIRNTRPHLYWMGFADSPKDYKPIEHGNYGKYWQTVRDAEKVVDLDFPSPPEDLVELIGELRELNPEKGQYGGNGWANYAATYFNDTYRFGKGLMRALRPGGKAYVAVGNSILQGINFRTDRHLAKVCEKAGVEIVDIYTPRNARTGNSIIQSEVRVTKAKQSHQLYESVVELRKPQE
jgi:DNA modification methylase